MIPDPELATPEREKEAYTSIIKWAEAQDMDPKELGSGIGEHERQSGPRKMILNLSALSDEDLSRIQIPLDLMMKIKLS